MYGPRQGIDSYRRTEIESRTPLELIVMLYDGALRHLGEARGAIERRDLLARKAAISRSMAIVAELQATLDMQAGAEIAASLDQLYTFVTSRIADASMKNDVKGIDDAIRVMTNLREAWDTIAKNDKGSKGSMSSTGSMGSRF